jgi:predicted enzyme related to lactoylglutathione lyase
MPEVNKYDQGTPSWVGLATTDVEGAESFYGALFGWEADHQPSGEGMIYSMQILKGKSAAAIYKMDEEQVKQGIPPHWVTYITVNDVDAATAKVEPAGGKVVMHPFDVMDNGRMAIISDPEGSVFCLWQPMKNIGAEIVNEHGAVCWNELAVNDPKNVIPFYSKVLDIDLGKMEGSPMEYWLFKVGGRDVGGILRKNEQMNDLPSHWSVYFTVDDCDGIVEKAKSMKAQVIVPPTDMGPGRFAVLQDPQSAVFSVIKMTVPSS